VSLVYIDQHGLAPPYPADELHGVADVESRQRLGSASSTELVVSSTMNLTIDDRAFPVAAVRVWHSLPQLAT